MALAEIREEGAPPDIAALYESLRRATGVPLVNLIHRHLATLPGVLPWAWQAIRPPLESGRLAEARGRLAAALPLPLFAPLPAAGWRAAGLAPEERPRVAALVEVYDRGNLTNLILLTALRRALEGVAAEAEAAPPPAATPPPPAMLPTPPPLPRLEALPPEVAARVQALAARHAPPEAGVTPSLYLHLAHWPALPAALPGWLAPLLEPAALASARDATVRLAEREADSLRPLLAVGAGVPAPHGPAVLAVVTRFTREVIPGMVPVGLALRRLLAPEAATGGMIADP
jgi:hypothetical protein